MFQVSVSILSVDGKDVITRELTLLLGNYLLIAKVCEASYLLNTQHSDLKCFVCTFIRYGRTT